MGLIHNLVRDCLHNREVFSIYPKSFTLSLCSPSSPRKSIPSSHAVPTQPVPQFETQYWKILQHTYVYWTAHHLDSWITRDQLDVTCCIISLFNAQHVSDVNTSILRSLRLIYWVISWVVLLLFDVYWCYVVVWLGWCGVRMQAEAVFKPA